MLKSKIYSKYFPVKDKYTQFEEKDKKILCEWVNEFQTEVRLRLVVLGKKGFLVPTYNWNFYDKKVMTDMIKQNHFDDEYLVMLNIIIYRHKYNAIISLWLFPVITKEEVRKVLSDNERW